MRLYSVKNTGNKYCGPAAISILTGIGTAEAARIIRRENPGKKFVKGSTWWEMKQALQSIGFSAHRVHIGKPQPGRWMSPRTASNFESTGP